MLFNSLEFLFFLPIVIFLYFAIPHRFRWILMLVASYTFYMFWRVDYSLILIFSTIIDYVCGRMMSRLSFENPYRKVWLWISLVSNLGILFIFKYFNFFNSAAKDLATFFGVEYAIPSLELLLPMGISFYTFQTMSYSIDVYNNRVKAEKHFGIFALFVTFFPQLVAGPIERAENLLNQLRRKNSFDFDRLLYGLQLIGWGLFKKVVIADRLARLVNEVYNDPTSYQGLPLVLATIFFAFQIYCDFSGYSDIAIGSARILGYDLMVNFKRPYFSKSIKEFWSRWHISLSTWFRDYVYIPLGGNRVVKWRWYYNVFIVFLISGVWHGANWTFIIWGALHGFYQISSFVFNRYILKVSNFIRVNKFPFLLKVSNIFITFLLVCFAWIFFRANSLSDAIYIVKNLHVGFFQDIVYSVSNFNGLRNSLLYLNHDFETFVLAVLGVIILIFVEFVNRSKVHSFSLPTNSRIGFVTAAYLLILAILLFGVFDSNAFIYFQF